MEGGCAHNCLGEHLASVHKALGSTAELEGLEGRRVDIPRGKNDTFEKMEINTLV